MKTMQTVAAFFCAILMVHCARAGVVATPALNEQAVNLEDGSEIAGLRGNRELWWTEDMNIMCVNDSGGVAYVRWVTGTKLTGAISLDTFHYCVKMKCGPNKVVGSLQCCVFDSS